MEDSERKLCANSDCDNLATSKGWREGGKSRRYSRFCSTCKKNRSKKVEKVKCEICGFVPVHKAQLDIDHIDGNRMNNDILNLQVLCANCHRLKTMENGDHLF